MRIKKVDFGYLRSQGRVVNMFTRPKIRGRNRCARGGGGGGVVRLYGCGSKAERNEARERNKVNFLRHIAGREAERYASAQ